VPVSHGMSRRAFLAVAAVGTMMAGHLPTVHAEGEALSGPFSLPALPYAADALDPIVSARTVGFHYEKHHRTYVDNLNRAVAGTAFAQQSLVEVIRATAGKPEQTTVFNNAAQAWNHTFYWRSMHPKGGGAPRAGKLKDLLDADLGGIDGFTTQFAGAASGLFGSGWVWLIHDGRHLAILKTANADTPVATGNTALLCCDVWEHAYYLDYQNRRGDYVKAFLEKVVNWDFAAENLG